MYPVAPSIPNAAGKAERKQRRGCEADLLSQFAPRCRFWRLTVPHSTTGQVPPGQIRASGNTTRKAVRQAKSRSDASGARPRPDMAETFIKRPQHLKSEHSLAR